MLGKCSEEIGNFELNFIYVGACELVVVWQKLLRILCRLSVLKTNEIRRILTSNRIV